jgi:hypothetical protein
MRKNEAGLVQQSTPECPILLGYSTMLMITIKVFYWLCAWLFCTVKSSRRYSRVAKKDPSPQKGRVGWGRGRETLTGDTVQVACPVGGGGSRTHRDLTAVVAKFWQLIFEFRHSGEGRNPVNYKCCEAGQNQRPIE